MKIRLRTLLYGLLSLALAGAVVYWSGIISISASSGHWGITNWFLHKAMQRSVSFHARDIEPPDPLVTAARVRRGAGHYEVGCAPCHGSPARPNGPVPHSMTPHPPMLDSQIPEWETAELFWIVKHGVKFSGMPAWPTLERDDEVWAMTAFLLELPEMTAETYLDLAYGTPEPDLSGPGGLSLVAQPPLAGCTRCHGREGLGDPSGAFPRLDIQSEAYLLASLRAYHAGERDSGIMQSAAAPLAPAELAELAAHYAKGGPIAPAPLDPSDVSPEVLARGEQIARHGIPAEGVGACLGCHGAEARRDRPEFPRIDGQYPDYLELQLALFATEARHGGTDFVNLMTTATHMMSSPDIIAVSAWFAARDPRGPAAEQSSATPALLPR